MKRFITFLLITILVFSLGVSCFASSYPSLPSDGLDNYVVFSNDDWDGGLVLVKTNATRGEFSYKETDSYGDDVSILSLFTSSSNVSSIYYLSETGVSWDHADDLLYAPMTFYEFSGECNIIAHNFPIDVYPKPGTYCDGSSCPANDSDYNNICDDCGKPLAMSLRTTLFEYAILHAREGNEYYGYDYFAIFYPSNEAEWDSKYHVYLSKTPFVPVANGYVGEDIKTCVVQRTALGENGATGWSSATSVPLRELAYAEPEINFPLPPLEETVQEVTEGALTEEMTKLAQTVKIILIIAVSCLALWVLLEIFFKVFRIFRVK